MPCLTTASCRMSLFHSSFHIAVVLMRMVVFWSKWVQYDSTAFLGRGCCFGMLGSAWCAVVTLLEVSSSHLKWACFEKPNKRFASQELFTCYV